MPPLRLKCLLMPGLAVLTGLMTPGGAQADVEAGVRAFEQGDYQAALDEWRVDAAQGNANALFNIGQAYRLGKGVETDIDQAETYYQRAARAGHPAAMGNLATLFYFSKNPPRVEEAVYWWEMGAAAGDPRSQYVLGAMTFNGDPVEKDLARAYAWTWLAARTGLAEAKSALATMRQYVPEADRQTAEAGARDMMTETGKTYWQTQLPADVAAQAEAGPDIAQAVEEAPMPAPEAPVAPPQPEPAPAPAETTGPAYRINLASMGSRDDAEAARRTVTGEHGDILSEMPLRIVEAEREGRLFYRLQAGRFATAAEAQARCERLREGGLDCFILHTEN